MHVCLETDLKCMELVFVEGGKRRRRCRRQPVGGRLQQFGLLVAGHHTGVVHQAARVAAGPTSGSVGQVQAGDVQPRSEQSTASIL